MIIKSKVQYLNNAPRENKKKNIWVLDALFMQGTETITLECMTSECEDKIKALTPLQEIVVVGEYSVKYQYMKLADVIIEQAKK